MPKMHSILFTDNMIEKCGYLDVPAINIYLEAINSWLLNKKCNITKLNEFLIKKINLFKNETVKSKLQKALEPIPANSEQDTQNIPFSEYIFLLCTEYDIEPILILSLIQKEQSALFKSHEIPESVQDKIVGFGNTENKSVPDKFVGFENELFGAIRQFRRYDEFLEVRQYYNTNIRLYDSNETLKQYGYENARYIKAENFAEAKAFLYNPRIEGIVNHKEIWNEVFKKCNELKIIKTK